MATANHIQIKSATGQPVAYLSPQADGVKDAYPDNRMNGESTFTFKLPANSPKIDKLTPDCEIWAGGRVYSLLKDEAADVERDQQGKLWAVFMTKERWNDLQYQYPEPYITNDPNIPDPMELETIIVSGGTDLSGGLYDVGTAAHALHAVLAGSGWTVGTVDVTGIHDLETDKTNRLELVRAIQNIWGGYIVWDSVNKVVHLRDGSTWQNYTGFQVRYAKNLKHITRTQNNRIITKLYPFGHDNLDISSINDGVKYITNYSFSSRDLVGVYQNQDIYEPQELLEKATAELAILCRPRYQYTVKLTDLRTLPEYSHEDFSVGDMADIIDPNVAANSPRVRILRHRYNLFQPWECEIELGDPLERFVEQLKASFDTSGLIDGKFNGSGKFSGFNIEDLTIDDVKIKSISAEKVFGNLVQSNTAVTHVLYAQEGRIARLTVDRLLTGSPLSGDEYIYFQDQRLQYHRFIEGHRRNDLPLEHYIDEDGNPLYWNNESHEYITPNVTEWPVMVPVYDLITKLEFFFDGEDGTAKIPKIVLGAGVGDPEHPDRGKGFIYKDEEGLLLKYKKSDSSEASIYLSEDGTVQSGNTGEQGLRNIYISDTEPSNPQENDLWINTGDDSAVETTESIVNQNTLHSIDRVKVWVGTAEEYSELIPSPDTLYYIEEE